MANQTDLEKSLLEAIGYLVDNRVQNLERDKTITATIVSCDNALEGKYKIQYNDGILTAYAQEGASYNANQTVYVLIPLGDLSQKKTIIGTASNVSDDNNLTFVSSMLNNYNMIGKNVITDDNSKTPIGLNSYYKDDYVLLYDREYPEESLLQVNQDEFLSYIKNADALAIEGTFQTRLPRAHRLSKTGRYGIQFVLAFKDTQYDKVNKYDEYLPQVPDVVTELQEELATGTLDYYKKKLVEVWSDPELTLEQKQQANDEYIQEMQDILNNVASVAPTQQNGALSDFADKISTIEKEEDVETVFEELEEETVPAVKHLSYVIDTNNMTGNPLLYTQYTNQYAIYPIDAENFLYIESIMAFSNDFVTGDNNSNATLWGDDIFIKEFEIYGLQEISATNGDYTLRVSTPQGALFKSLRPEETLSVVASTLYQVNTDISDSASYYWFAKDDRISSASEEYQMYGGAGWRFLKDMGYNKSIALAASENRAYENIYMVVSVYKESVILKQTFTIYNEASRREISIESDLGLKFSFDRGTPTLTCLIDGRKEDFDENHEDSLFSFSWSKIDENGTTTSFSQTYEELDEQYQQAIKDGAGYSQIVAIKNQMLAMSGVEFDRNILKYPIKQIDFKATFSCSVYLKETADAAEYFIGSAEITLQNENAASPTDYYILIENGDQVFQYSESGVSPASERYTDPLEIKPLECHFYDTAGLEVNAETYSVKWKVPTTSSLIVIPEEGMNTNPANDKLEWYTQTTYPTMIADSYDYQALNNQVTCIVTYDGQEYQQDTNFLFVKVGDNGTNGTDMVGKISPIQEPQEGRLAIVLQSNQNPRWNNGQSLSEAGLKYELYQRNELLNLTNTYWTVSGTSSKYLSIDSSGIVSWKDEVTKNALTNFIVRAQTTFENQDYYAFYPIPVINYKSGVNYEIVLDKTKTLKDILYNADGRNPLYNKNQGIFFTIKSDYDLVRYITVTCEGGATDGESTAAFFVSSNRDDDTNEDVSTYSIGQEVNTNEEIGFFVHPDDIYDGAYTNNRVHVKIYLSQSAAQGGGNTECEFYVPIHMSLNTFGLASLNAWDGNHVEINEEGNYIVAPQIGAGVKDENNRFTGIVMGTAKTYDQEEESVGLLGYSQGKQSIWLDADTGNAIFGLPEEQASTNNKFIEGRIELIPGGQSKIGMWNIGSRAMYNMTAPPTMRRIERQNEDGSVEYVIQIEDNDGNWIDLDESTRDVLSNENFHGVEPESPAYSSYQKTSSKYNVANASVSIPPDAQGMVLGANPAYLTVKSMPLTEQNSEIDWDGANTALKQGDSIEVEIDPLKSSVFSIYRHTLYDGSTLTNQWRRYPLVGINSNGQFYTNAIEDGESSMGIGKIGAFGAQAADGKYVGAQFAYQGANIFKFFIDEDSSSVETRPVYLSTGTTIRNEYPRPFNIYGKTVSLYAESSNATSKTSPTGLKISDSTNDSTSLFTETSSVSLPNLSNGTMSLSTTANLSIFSNDDRTTTVSVGSSTLRIGHTLNASINPLGNRDQTAISATIMGRINIGGLSNLAISSDANSGSWKMNISNSAQTVGTDESTPVTNSQIYLGNNIARFELNNSTVARLQSDNGIRLISKNGNGIGIKSDKGSINLDATWSSTANAAPAYLHLLPASDGYSSFYLNSGYGAIRSVGSAQGFSRNGVQITDGVFTPWGQFTGAISGSSNSILATNDITANGHLKSIKNVYGNNFLFNSAKGWTCLGEDRRSTSLESHLSTIYSLIQRAYNRAQEYYDSHISNSLAGYATQNWVSTRGYATQSWVNSQEFATQDWSLGRFPLLTDYRSHNHSFTYGMTTVNGTRVVNSISMSSGDYTVTTRVPSTN